MRRDLYGLLIALALGGCQLDREPVREPQVRDSAGVRILTSTLPSGEASRWTLSSTPVLSIGAAEGSEEQLLYRVYAAVALENGEILVSNSGSSEVRTYARDGNLSRSFGREGAGPGEFGSFSSMRLYLFARDSLAVTDERNLRLNIFSTAGVFDRSIRFAVVEGYGRPTVGGVFSDGQWLIETPQGSGVLQGDVGERLDTWWGFFRHAPDGASATHLIDVEGRPRIVNSLGGGAIHYPFVPLTPDPVFAVLGNDLLVGSGAEPELLRVDSAGRVRSIMRWNQSRTQVREVWDRFASEFLAEVPEDRKPAYARLLAMDGLPIPDAVPAIEGLLVDRQGTIWVQEYRLPWQASRVWQVLSADGAWLGQVTTPPRTTVLDIGLDYLLGRQVDDAGVEHIVVYALNRERAS